MNKFLSRCLNLKEEKQKRRERAARNQARAHAKNHMDNIDDAMKTLELLGNLMSNGMPIEKNHPTDCIAATNGSGPGVIRILVNSSGEITNAILIEREEEE